MTTTDQASELGDVLDAVGPRLRSLRTRRGTSLTELSQTTGISVSTLSRLETGQRRPTLELLLPLARAYQVTLDDLVGAPETADPRVHIRPVVHHGVAHVPLTRRVGGQLAAKLILPPVDVVTPPDLQTHEGYEWLYVLSGRLRLILGEHDVVLTEGEVAEFNCRTTPHWFGNPGPGPTELLSIFGPQGERIHVRAAPKRRQG
ncbi:helix-turn-helix domain-containing protein [Occultella kanbiaonis]|uniref:helix-turn-helix domain-containing protein n=1 Tax=Occultella kanbiaonis TaxID=2675754 RepID=UPI0012B9A20D|nr:XRE family transcriptional regulator [Occultella kanbiaonis]